MIDTDARKAVCCDIDRSVRMWDMESGIALGGAQVGHKRGEQALVHSLRVLGVLRWDSAGVGRKEQNSQIEILRYRYGIMHGEESVWQQARVKGRMTLSQKVHILIRRCDVKTGEAVCASSDATVQSEQTQRILKTLFSHAHQPRSRFHASHG